MSDDVFTDPENADAPDESWVDVRMTEPEAGEWNVDAVVVDGQVQYVDLHVRPDLLADFIDCLVDDVGRERARTVLADVADRHGLDLSGEVPEE